MTRVLILLVLLGLSKTTWAVDALTNYPLVNQRGKPFQLYDLKGQFVLISFVFTRCPLQKMCPLTVSLNKRVMTDLSKEKNAPKTHFLFVTLDPDYDTPSVLTKFAKTRGLDKSNVTLATGNSNVLAELASQFNVIGFPAGGSSLISHNLKTILLDPTFKTIKEFKDNDWSAKDVLRAIFSGPVS